MKLLYILFLTTTISFANDSNYFNACIKKINLNKLESYTYTRVITVKSSYLVKWKFANIKKPRKILSKKEIKQRAIEFCNDKLGKDFILEETVELFTHTLNGVELYFVKLSVNENFDFVSNMPISFHVMIPMNKNGDILCELKPTK